MKRKINGFTIIELLVVVTIIGIISSVAIPNFRDYIASAKREVAQASMLELGIKLQKVRNKTFSFANGVAANKPLSSVYPDTVSYDGEIIYNITVPQVNASSFTIQATPTNGMVNTGPMRLTYLDGQLIGTWDNDSNGSYTEIWRR